MEWYQVVPIVVSVLTLLGVGSFFSLLWKERFEKRKTETAQEKERIKKEKQEEMREVIREEIKPLKEDIEQFKELDELQRKSIQAILRDRLYELSSAASKKGYTTLNERENFENMYVQYHKLGKNGVMDSIRDDYFSYPTEERHKEAEKKVKRYLVE